MGKLDKWCPGKKHCGKCVKRDWDIPRDSPKPYYCERCKEHFSKKQLDKIN